MGLKGFRLVYQGSGRFDRVQVSLPDSGRFNRVQMVYQGSGRFTRIQVGLPDSGRFNRVQVGLTAFR